MRGGVEDVAVVVTLTLTVDGMDSGAVLVTVTMTSFTVGARAGVVEGPEAIGEVGLSILACAC